MEKAHHAWQICLKAPIILLFKGMISIFHCSKVWFQSGLVDCQSGIWRKTGLGVTGKEARSGTVGSLFTYVGTSGSIAMYCREFLESPQSTALVVVSLLTNAQSTQPD